MFLGVATPLQLSHIMKRILQFQFNFSASFSPKKRMLFSTATKKYMENLEEEEGEEPYKDVPKPMKKWVRKPYVTPMKVLIRRAKQERKARQESPCQILEHAPENGLVVPELIDVAHQVQNDRISLVHCLSNLIEGGVAIPVHKCRFCPELHVGLHGHEIRTCEGPGSASRNSFHVWRRGGVKDILGFAFCYHLFDRVVKPRVGHKERFKVPRLPAITELCIQAGLNLVDYPTKRRTVPVYSVEGRVIDFETHNEEYVNTDYKANPIRLTDSIFEEEENMHLNKLATKTLSSWLNLRVGAMKIMQKYNVVTCGYCPEVQVGPKGHKVRMCKAAKHQFRDGQHAWQEATIDDLIRPNIVWHARNPQGPPLTNVLKRYYGKAPAVVELCVQAGAPIPKEYCSMMRLDVVLPDLDEYDLVT